MAKPVRETLLYLDIGGPGPWEYFAMRSIVALREGLAAKRYSGPLAKVYDESGQLVGFVSSSEAYPIELIHAIE